MVADLLALELHEEVEGEEGAVGEQEVVLHLQVGHPVLGLDLLAVHLLQDWLQLVVQGVQGGDELLHQVAELWGVVGDDLVNLVRGEGLSELLEVLVEDTLVRLGLGK